MKIELFRVAIPVKKVVELLELPDEFIVCHIRLKYEDEAVVLYVCGDYDTPIKHGTKTHEN